MTLIESPGEALLAAVLANPQDEAPLRACVDYLLDTGIELDLAIWELAEQCWLHLANPATAPDLFYTLSYLWSYRGWTDQADGARWLAVKHRSPSLEAVRFLWWDITVYRNAERITAIIPPVLDLRIHNYDVLEWNAGSATRRRAYELLLLCWTCLLPDERQECWTWEPPQ